MIGCGEASPPTTGMRWPLLFLASDTNSPFHPIRSRGQVVVPSLARGEASGVVAPGAIGSRGVADEAPGHLARCKWSADWRDVSLASSKDQPHGWVETVGAGARKSVCFCSLLRWSVGRHGLLRSRWTYFPPVRGSWLSELTLIAFWGKTSKCVDDVPQPAVGYSDPPS